MLGHLVSMGDEEVLHTVHGGICLCWCFTLVSAPWLMFSGEEGGSVNLLLLLLYMQQQDHWHSSTAEAITGEKRKKERVMT